MSADHNPYLETYDQIMKYGTSESYEYQCNKCGWKVDQEDCIETSNQFMGATANIKRYHKFCHKGSGRWNK